MICFKIKSEFDSEEAWSQLENNGYELLYLSENDKGNVEIYAKSIPSLEGIPEKFAFVERVDSIILPPIDWTAQWAEHGIDYRDGYVHVDLVKYGCSAADLKAHRTILLRPGPGFGDLSHPTTHLVLQMMCNKMKRQYVLDIGSGSGILSLAAVAMGALHAQGIDIDTFAVMHSQENALINEMEDRVYFDLPKHYHITKQRPMVILMNMIQSEQKEAWEALENRSLLSGTILSSGILKEGRENYLQQAKEWGWTLIEEKEHEGWLGFHFTF